MRIRWTSAAADLQSISDYLKEHHPRYRDPTMRKLYGAYPRVEGMAGAWPTGARARNPRTFGKVGPRMSGWTPLKK
jgi:hypothetical protein